MKKLLAIVFIVTSLVGLSQVPQKINYQGVARDASGTALANTPLTLTITISNTISNYSEQHLSVTSNSVGIFTLLIGTGSSPSSSFPAFDWSAPADIEVWINAGFGSQYMGKQALASVPYALYAQKVIGAGALPTGTVTGQTLYWDATSTTPTWKISNNLSNDGNHVGVGILPVGLKNKLHAVTGNPADSAAIMGFHFNADKNEAGVRGVATGAAPSSTFEPISGGNFIGYNYAASSGVGVGATGQGFSNAGDAIGLIGIGTSSSVAFNTGRSVGLYATALGGYFPNSYAGIFDRGKVLINDTLLFPTSGNANDILIKQANGKAVWTSPSSITAGPWTKLGGTVSLTTNSDLVEIGGPSGSAKLQIATTTTFTGADLSITSLGASYGLQVIKSSITNTTAGTALFTNLLSASIGTVITIGNTGQGPGMYIDNGSNNAIFARSTGTVPTIFGHNWNGTGPSIKGTKTATNGSAGIFEVTYTNSPSDALIASNTGKGAAIHALLGPTVTGSSNSAILLEEGHASTTSSVSLTTQTITSLQGGGSLLLMPTSTDVAGKITINTGGPGPFASGMAYARIIFNKNYTVAPIVILTPASGAASSVQYFVNTSPTDFTISLGGSIPPGNSLMFNYIVIEAK